MANFRVITPNVVESARFKPPSWAFLFWLDLADLAGLASMGVRVAIPAAGWPDVRRLVEDPGRFDFIMGDVADARVVVRWFVLDCHDLVRVVECRLADLRLLSTEAYDMREGVRVLDRGLSKEGLDTGSSGGVWASMAWR
jgi:hypothetical protein